jgi:hypothetical protein
VCFAGGCEGGQLPSVVVGVVDWGSASLIVGLRVAVVSRIRFGEKGSSVEGLFVQFWKTEAGTHNSWFEWQLVLRWLLPLILPATTIH